jgi:glycosyltransferase involved in cell wall biosynthesis
MSGPKRRIRLLYLVSQSVRWVAFEWIAAGLSRERFDLSFLLLSADPHPMTPYLEAQGVPTYHVPIAGKHALAGAARTIARHCRDRGIDIVHAHFMDACLAGLTGARIADVPVRLHTRHHAGPYPWSHRAPWGAWYDRWNNRLSTCIIAPSEWARRTLVEYDRVPPGKVVVIPHGFDLDAFRNVDDADVDRMRARYGLGDDRPVVGVVARYERIKGIEPIILAFRKLLGAYPTARLVLANARGRRVGPIRQLLRSLPAGRFTEIPFEEEMPALYWCFDVFVHAPIHPRLEAFGQVYVEAMAAGVPCVCAPAGIACEFLRDGENALVVRPDDPDQIHAGILRVLGDPSLRGRLTDTARRDVEGRFGLDRLLRALEDLYIRLHDASGANRP